MQGLLLDSVLPEFNKKCGCHALQIRTFVVIRANSVQVLRYTGHTIYYYVSLCIGTPNTVLISMSCSHCNMTTGDTPIVFYSLQQLLYWRT